MKKQIQKNYKTPLNLEGRPHQHNIEMQLRAVERRDSNNRIAVAGRIGNPVLLK